MRMMRDIAAASLASAIAIACGDSGPTGPSPTGPITTEPTTPGGTQVEPPHPVFGGPASPGIPNVAGIWEGDVTRSHWPVRRTPWEDYEPSGSGTGKNCDLVYQRGDEVEIMEALAVGRVNAQGRFTMTRIGGTTRNTCPNLKEVVVDVTFRGEVMEYDAILKGGIGCGTLRKKGTLRRVERVTINRSENHACMVYKRESQ